MELLEIVDKALLTISLLSEIPCYCGIFMIPLFFDIVDKIFQQKAIFQRHWLRSFKVYDPSFRVLSKILSNFYIVL